jgi:hypothetical protein
LAHDTSPEIHAAQLQAYRRMGAAARARVAGDLSNATREMARAGIRSRHPEYREDQVELALRRIILGDDLFRRAWPTQPLLAP